MTAYQFYSRDDLGKLHLIAVLPERRTQPERITDQSIITWARSLFGEAWGVKNVIYRTVKIVF